MGKILYISGTLPYIYTILNTIHLEYYQFQMLLPEKYRFLLTIRVRYQQFCKCNCLKYQQFHLKYKQFVKLCILQLSGILNKNTQFDL